MDINQYFDVSLDTLNNISKESSEYKTWSKNKKEKNSVLKYLNLENINCRNLKVSNMDFRETNIRINPQMVYMKDLSNTLYDEENIIGDLTDCITDGSNMEFVDFDSTLTK